MSYKLGSLIDERFVQAALLLESMSVISLVRSVKVGNKVFNETRTLAALSAHNEASLFHFRCGITKSQIAIRNATMGKVCTSRLNLKVFKVYNAATVDYEKYFC